MTAPDDDAVERIAMFLRLNYVPGTTHVNWADAEQDERDAWLAEAAHIYQLATQQ